MAIQEDDRVNIQRVPIAAQLYLYQKNQPKKKDRISWAVGVTLGQNAYKKPKEEALRRGERESKATIKERFKARHVIKSYERFSESDSVVIENIEDALPQIRDHSLATKQLEGQQKDKERLTVVVCCNGDGSNKVPFWVIVHFINVSWNIDVKPTTIAISFRHCNIRSEEDIPLEQEIGDVKVIHKLKKVISDLHYRNAMDIDQILNYPSENESLMESPTNEEIIQGVMDVSTDDEQDLDYSSLLPHVSPKEAFLAVDTLKNYLIQHENNIPYLVYALLKVKDEIEFDSHTKKKQLTIDAYFSKE
ncbi:uncharacterized protein [Gossypium hirsutum]|uniref:Uncharacterized protein n=1 Tax=Gossypium hirsutum TaxID=3635 RepID=A0ABM2ZNQ4_GOSHI|nr:uncharacterized protein LOC121214574 [Gossypium hirsutum]